MYAAPMRIIIIIMSMVEAINVLLVVALMRTTDRTIQSYRQDDDNHRRISNVFIFQTAQTFI